MEQATDACPHEVLSTRLVGLPGFRVLTAGEVGRELEVLVETAATVVGCAGCGVPAVPHGRREHLVRDVPSGGRAVLLVWSKRLWRCPEPACPARTWTETSDQVRPRAALTERARRWACQRVGRDGDTVAGVAAELGVSWGTVWRAVVEHGRPLVDDLARIAGVTALGVDEHVWQHAGKHRRGPGFATGIVDISPGRSARLLDVVPGRTGKVYADWLGQREPAWRAQVRVAALDPFRGYATALAGQLPDAVRVLDAFHVVKLGNDVVDQVRRRVQQEQLGHRGHRDDPLYQIRRLLRRGVETLTDRHRERIQAALQAGDPDREVTLAWHCAQRLRAIYKSGDPKEGRRRAVQVLDSFASCPIPEVARLGRTLRAWRGELLAYFDTGGASNGPTEATNLVVEKTRRIGHGYRNFGNYRLRLILLCGVDWQTPQTPRIRSRRPRLVA